MPILPSRRRSAGNSRRRRGRQNSHSPTASKLPRRTARVSGASSRLLVRRTRLLPDVRVHAQNGHTLVENGGTAAERSVSPTVVMA